MFFSTTGAPTDALRANVGLDIGSTKLPCQVGFELATSAKRSRVTAHLTSESLRCKGISRSHFHGGWFREAEGPHLPSVW